MTTSNDLLLPGPELDALVAEKVMGWSKSKRIAGEWTVPLPDEPTIIMEIKVTPRFSNEMDSAWCVVKRMSELGFHITIEQYGIFEASSEWFVYFDEPPKRGGRKGSGQDRWAPKAICYAALYALEIWRLP